MSRRPLAGDALGNLTPLGLLISEPAKVVLLARRQGATRTLAALAVENLFYTLSVALILIVAGLLALIVRFRRRHSWLAGDRRRRGLVGSLVLGVGRALVIWRRVSWPAGGTRLLGMGRWRGGWVDAALSWLGGLETCMHAPTRAHEPALILVAGPARSCRFTALAMAEIYVVLASGRRPVCSELARRLRLRVGESLHQRRLQVRAAAARRGRSGHRTVRRPAGSSARRPGVTLAIIRKGRMSLVAGVGAIGCRRCLAPRSADRASVRQPRTAPPGAAVVAVIAIMARSPAGGATHQDPAGERPCRRVRIAASLYAAFLADTVHDLPSL